MNRVYVVSDDGQVFSADSSSSAFEILNTGSSFSTENRETVLTRRNSNIVDSPIQIKRISSCKWCLWAISSKYELYLNVFQSDTPIEHQEVIYENEVNIISKF